MTDAVDIEIQDKHGNWRRYSTVPNVDAHIKQALQSALMYRLDDHPEAARAVDQKSKRVLAVLQG